MWFDKNTDQNGETIEKFILENNISLLDEDQFTFCRGASQSHIDLTLVSPELLLDLYWDTYKDPCNSDHVPILIKTVNKHPNESKPRWNLNKADWTKFSQLAKFEKHPTEFNSIDSLCDYIVKVINDAANKSIPKTIPIPGKISVPWWNSCCRVAVARKKTAYRRYLRSPTLQNFNLYKSSRRNAKAFYLNHEV